MLRVNADFELIDDFERGGVDDSNIIRASIRHVHAVQMFGDDRA